MKHRSLSRLAILVTVAAIFGLWLQGCSQSSYARAEAAAPNTDHLSLAAAKLDYDGQAAPGDYDKAGSGSNGRIAAKPTIDVRKRIITGSMDLQVVDLNKALADLNSRLPGLGAYLASSQTEASWASLVIRVPAEGYDKLFGDLGGIGKVLRSSTAAEDVTDQWFDLDSRVRSKRILQERYLAYLRVAKNVEDLMTIERQVNEVTAEIEQLEGSFKRLSNQVAYSTVTVNLSLPGNPDRSGFDLGAAMGEFLHNVGDFFQGALVVLLYFIVIGAPLVLLGVFLWWLLFGRIGWLRRLFKKAAKSPPAT